MLTHLSIDNFAIAQHLEAELQGGMTTITGETGAGKSIMLDAAGLALGNRADANMIRCDAERADIHATFDIQGLPEAQQWLTQHDLQAGDECLLRRVITREGRSRSYINGRPVTLQDLKTLGSILIDIHSQHAHQALLKKSHQQKLLDEFAGCGALVEDIKQLSKQHQQVSQTLQTLQDNAAEFGARAQLLSYQVEELHQLELADGEPDELEQEHKRLTSAEDILHASQHAMNLCSEGENSITDLLNQTLSTLATLTDHSPTLANSHQSLSDALIQVEEATSDLQHFVGGFEQDPQRLQWLEQRLSSIHDIARKHRCAAAQLPALQQDLEQELQKLQNSDDQIGQLQAEQQTLARDYQAVAKKLSNKRRKAATKLQQQVEAQLAELSMGNCQFHIELTAHDDQQLHGNGNESVTFLVNTNPGQALQPLAKIASGGELSRISLAIQVITAKTSAVPTLVFDEVDVGIGGATAEVVGRLLRELGEQGQVICVTHQPQVASQAHHHLVASKAVKKKQTTAQLHALNDQSKVDEIARMLGGIAISDHSRAHAKEMLSVAH